jgi:hypothetical protein
VTSPSMGNLPRRPEATPLPAPRADLHLSASQPALQSIQRPANRGARIQIGAHRPERGEV